MFKCKCCDVLRQERDFLRATVQQLLDTYAPGKPTGKESIGSVLAEGTKGPDTSDDKYIIGEG